MNKPDISLLGGIDVLHFQKPKRRHFLKDILSAVSGLKPLKYHKQGVVSKGLFGYYPPYFKGMVQTEWTMGYYFAIKKSLFIKSQIMFDERLKKYGYAEDLDYSFRMFMWSKKHHYNCVLDDSVQVLHKITSEYRNEELLVYKKILVNRYYIFKKIFKNNIFRSFYFNLATFSYAHIMKKKKHNKEYIRCYKSFSKNKNKFINGDLNYDF